MCDKESATGVMLKVMCCGWIDLAEDNMNTEHHEDVQLK